MIALKSIEILQNKEMCKTSTLKTIKHFFFLKNIVKSKEHLSKWKGMTCLQIRRLNIIKVTLFPKLIYRLNTIHIKIPAKSFCLLQNSQADPKV